MNINTYFSALGILISIGFLHNVGGIIGNAYNEIWWWDIMLHFLGGVWLAMSGFWFVYLSDKFNIKRSVKNFFIATLVPVLVIGLGWEVFEYVNGITFVLPGERYEIDTIGDVFVDLAGGMLVYLYYRLKYWRDFLKPAV